MKKLNIFIQILFAVILFEVNAQENCYDFSSIQTGSYNVGDVIFSTNDYTIVSDNFFTGGTCGGNGSYIENSNFNFQMNGNVSFNFDCAQKEVKFDFAPFAGQCFTLRVNDSIIGNETDLFLNAIPNVNFTFDATNNILTMIGTICTIQVGADYLYLDEVCVTQLSVLECVDYVTVSEPEGIYLGVGDTTFIFDNTNQVVSMEIYGDFNSWDLSSNHQANQTYFTVNGGASVSLEDIYNNQPYTLSGVSITVDTTSLSFNNIGGSWTTGTILFSGNMSTIKMTQFESGLLKTCLLANQAQCTDYVTVLEPEGIYLGVGDTTFIFDNTNQVVSMEIYGLFNNWDLSSNHQADQTYFTVNGGAPVSLEDIYNNQPYTLNGVSITVDTASLSFNDVGGSWTTGTILLSGNISTIKMIQFESGLLKICSERQCQASADFTYSNNNQSYYFTSIATGTEYEWSFGDGELSSLENPFHDYEIPGTYNVCLVNYNLVNTCSITICDTVVVSYITPNANIITPNQDGVDDYISLQCNDVNIYDRNGVLIVSLVNETIWESLDSNGNLVPMGEYFIVCQSTGVTVAVTVIW